MVLWVLLLLLLSCLFPLHQFLLGTFGAQDISAVGDEAFAHQRAVAGGADEAVVMPMSVFEADEPSPTNARDGAGTGCTPLGKQLPKAVRAVRLVLP